MAVKSEVTFRSWSPGASPVSGSWRKTVNEHDSPDSSDMSVTSRRPVPSPVAVEPWPQGSVGSGAVTVVPVSMASTSSVKAPSAKEPPVLSTVNSTATTPPGATGLLRTSLRNCRASTEMEATAKPRSPELPAVGSVRLGSWTGPSAVTVTASAQVDSAATAPCSSDTDVEPGVAVKVPKPNSLQVLDGFG